MQLHIDLKWSAKVLAVLSLGAVSAITTYALTEPAAKPGAARPGGPRSTAEFTPSDGAARQPGLGSPGSYMQRLDAVAIGNFVRVEAVADVLDPQPHLGHAWSLRVVDPEDRATTLWEEWYDVVPTNGHEWTSVRLDEILELPLPDGQYSVEVDLFQVPNGPWPGVKSFPKANDRLCSVGGGRWPIEIAR